MMSPPSHFFPALDVLDDDDDVAPVLPSPFLAFAALFRLVALAIATKPQDDTESDDDDDAVIEARYLAFEWLLSWVVPSPTTPRPPATTLMPDADVLPAPLLALRAIADAARGAAADADAAPEAEADEQETFVYPGIALARDDALVAVLAKAVAFPLAALRVLAAPFSPSRAPPTIGIAKSPSKTHLKTASSEDLASLAGQRLFQGRGPKHAVRLRNAL